MFPVFIVTSRAKRVILIQTHNKTQKQRQLPIHYFYFITSFIINKEIIKVFQNYAKIKIS